MDAKENRKGTSKRRLVCLMCRETFLYDETDIDMKKAFPFCSARCKMADLDGWFTEEYRISRSIHQDDLEEEEAKSED